MELKKNPKADLATFRGLFLNIGIVLSLTFVITAFEWNFEGDGNLVDLGQVNDDFDEMLDIPPTEQPPPPPPKIQQPEIIEVPDEEEIEEEIEVDLDIEMTEETVIEQIIIAEAPEEEIADEIFTIVEDQPYFVGGQAMFRQFILKNLVYPTQARRFGIEGKVFVQFVVERDGSLTDIKVLKGIGAGCDREAVRVLAKSPKWHPGKQRGNPVRVRAIIPLNFTL